MDDSNPIQPTQPPLNAIPPDDKSGSEKREVPRATADPDFDPTPIAKKKATECCPDQTPWWKYLIELAAVLTAIWYAIVATQQLGVVKGQLTEMQRSGKQSTEQIWKAIDNLNWLARSIDWSQKQSQQAIEASDKRSKESLDASVYASRLDQRAWVAVKSVKLTTPYSPTKSGEVTVWLANSGKTPAIATGIKEASWGSTKNSSFMPILGNTPIAIAPGSTDNELYINIPAGDTNLTFYLRFTIEYRDIFQDRSQKPHIATFCGYYPNPRSPNLENFAAPGCGEMN